MRQEDTLQEHLAFLEQAVAGTLSGRVSEWPQLRPALKWVVQEVRRLTQERDDARANAYAMSTLVPALRQQVTTCQEALRALQILLPGWRELVAELDEMPKSEVIGKTMWAVLNQMDTTKQQVQDALTAGGRGG